MDIGEFKKPLKATPKRRKIKITKKFSKVSDLVPSPLRFLALLSKLTNNRWFIFLFRVPRRADKKISSKHNENAHPSSSLTRHPTRKSDIFERSKAILQASDLTKLIDETQINIELGDVSGSIFAASWTCTLREYPTPSVRSHSEAPIAERRSFSAEINMRKEK